MDIILGIMNLLDFGNDFRRQGGWNVTHHYRQQSFTCTIRQRFQNTNLCMKKLFKSKTASLQQWLP